MPAKKKVVDEQSQPVEEPVEVEEVPAEEVEETPVEVPSEPPAEPTGWSPWVYKQRAVLYTDGVSGVADHDSARAYDQEELKPTNLDADKDYLPHKDILDAERKRRESYPEY